MPYLTFATYQNRETKYAEIESGEKAKATTGTSPGSEVEKSPKSPLIPQNRNDELSAAYSRNSNFKNDCKSTAKNDWKKLQESRTLDQFYYHSLSDTKIRNANQVVTRYIDMIKGKDH
jgi:hypothetical protein